MTKNYLYILSGFLGYYYLCKQNQMLFVTQFVSGLIILLTLMVRFNSNLYFNNESVEIVLALIFIFNLGLWLNIIFEICFARYISNSNTTS
jgi:hypothetical protein